MPHCDDSDLALIALGEPAAPVDDTHLQRCARCRSRVDQLGAVVSSARGITEADHPTPPPAHVWTAVTAELGLGGDDASTPLRSVQRPRGRAGWLIAAAAVTGLVLGGVATALVVSPKGDTTLVARASLDPVAGSAFAGSATVEQHDGHAVLRVDVPGLPAVDDGYYEVWMATADTATMVAIGTMNPGGMATFDLPQGMDMDAFPIVDVSVEHFDGDAGHSAVSVVRGSLST